MRLAAGLAVMAMLFSVPGATAVGLFQSGRSWVLLEAHADYCLPDLKVGAHIPLIDDVVVAFKKAMTANAALLKPDVPPEQLREDVDKFVEGWRADAAKAAASLGDCSKAADLRQQISLLPSSKLLDAIAAAGQRLERYDEKAQLEGASDGALSFAVPASQQNIVQGIRDNQGGKCAAPGIEAVNEVSREPKASLHLPPFVLPPISYVERWKVVCGDARFWMRVAFIQDSEGPTGTFSVQPDSQPN